MTAQEEDEEHKREAAAQQFLDEVLAAGDTPPVSHLPLLQGLLQPAGGEGAVPEAVQVMGKGWDRRAWDFYQKRWPGAWGGSWAAGVY